MTNETDDCPDHGDDQPVMRSYATRGSDPYNVNVLPCGCHVACYGPGEPNVVIKVDPPKLPKGFR